MWSRKLPRLPEKEGGLKEGGGGICRDILVTQVLEGVLFFSDHRLQRPPLFCQRPRLQMGRFPLPSEFLLPPQPFEDKADVLGVVKKEKSVSLVAWRAAVFSTELLNLSIKQPMLSWRPDGVYLSIVGWKTASGLLVGAIRPKRNVAFEAP